MTITINGSYSGIHTIRNISLIQRSLTRTMQRLSSAQEINQTADGPAELLVAEQMRTQIGSLTQRIKNLGLNLNKYDAADTAVSELRGKVVEMRNVAAAAANDESSTKDTGKAYQQQVDDLVTDYNQLRRSAVHGEKKLFDDSKGSPYKLTDIEGFNVSTPEDAVEAIKKIDRLKAELDKAKSIIGAKSRSEYDSTIRSLEVTSQNLTAAEGGIRDSDNAVEQADYLKQLIQLNANLAVEAQGNLASGSVFKLLHA